MSSLHAVFSPFNPPLETDELQLLKSDSAHPDVSNLSINKHLYIAAASKPFAINNADLDGDAEVIVPLFRHLRFRAKHNYVHHVFHAYTAYNYVYYPTYDGCLRFGLLSTLLDSGSWWGVLA